MSNVGGEGSSGFAYFLVTAYIMHRDAFTWSDLPIYLGIIECLEWVNGVWAFRWTRTCRHRRSWLCLMGSTVLLASFHIYKNLTRVACKSVRLFTGASADFGCVKYFLEILLAMHLMGIYVHLGSRWLLWWPWVDVYIRFADHLCPLIVGYSWGELHLVWNGTPTVPSAHWFCDFACVKRCCSCWCAKNCVSWVSDCCICSFCLSGFGCCCVGSFLCCCLCFLIRLKSRKRESLKLIELMWFVTGAGFVYTL